MFICKSNSIFKYFSLIILLSISNLSALTQDIELNNMVIFYLENIDSSISKYAYLIAKKPFNFLERKSFNLWLPIQKNIVKNINKERQSAQSFLTSLNQTLEELHHSIVSTSKHSESMSVEFDTLNKSIEDKIKKLNEQTQQATSISSLKELVDNKCWQKE